VEILMKDNLLTINKSNQKILKLKTKLEYKIINLKAKKLKKINKFYKNNKKISKINNFYSKKEENLIKKYNNRILKIENNSNIINNKYQNKELRKEKKIENLENKVPLPPFSHGEELFSAITHIVGAVIGIIVLVWGLIVATKTNNPTAIVSMAIYGSCMVILYTMSSIYHFLNKNLAKRVFRILDHCTIFLLIAGTYTPICLVGLSKVGSLGYIMLGIVWGLSIIGIVFNAINMTNKFVKILSQICYILLGWCVVIPIKQVIDVMTIKGFSLLLIGGIFYTIGTIFFSLGTKIKYSHPIWHLFVIAGSIFHFFCIIYYIL
jgi:hemolysin III